MRVKFKDEIRNEISNWQDKLADAEGELSEIPARRQALADRKALHVLAARTGDQEARAEIEAAETSLAELERDENELKIVIEQIGAKIKDLEGQRQAAERQTLIDQLNAQKPERGKLMQNIEAKTAELVELLSAASELGKSMDATGDRVYGYDSNAEVILRVDNLCGNYLHGALGRVFPSHFAASWGEKQLAETDKRRVDGFLKRALSRTTKGQKKW